MGFIDRLLWQAFGVPAGLLGRIGGRVMAGRRQRAIAEHVAELLQVQREDKVLEIGFGPGVGIQCLSERIRGEGLIVGIDPSDVMMQMAKARNAGAIEKGTVKLLSGTVEHIPWESEFFDKAYAMNSFHLWPDKAAGLSEVRRVLKPGGRLCGLSFYGAGGAGDHSGFRACGLGTVRVPGRSRRPKRSWSSTLLPGSDRTARRPLR